MPLRRLPTVVISSLVAVLCIVVLLSAAARLHDLATAPAGSGLSAVDGRHLAALRALLDWELTGAAYHDARTQIIASSERLRSHRVASLAHVTGGIVVLLLGGLQFAHGVRRRVPMLHRWSGRTLLVAAAITGVSGLYLGVGVPYAGVAEALPTLVFGTLFLLFGVRAYVAAKRGEYARHREWMIRMFSLAAGVGTIRLVGLGLFSAGVGMRELIGWSFAIGWVTSLVAAEWWIRHTRFTPDIDSPLGMPVLHAASGIESSRSSGR